MKNPTDQEPTPEYGVWLVVVVVTVAIMFVCSVAWMAAQFTRWTQQ